MVVGAGVLGAAVALGLARRGAQVTVLEARRPGIATTRTSFAWVNSANKEPESYFALNHAGIRAHREFAGESSPWFFPTGNLEWAVDEGHLSTLHSRVDKLRARDYPARWLTPEQARALEPDLCEQPRAAEYAFFPDEGHVFPLVLLGRMLGEARDRGARILHCAHVVEINADGVHTADGGRYSADVVVSCVGRWTATVASAAGAHIPMLDPDLPGSATVGFLATTEPLPVRLSRVLTTPRLNVRPDGAGRLMLQALDLDGDADPAVEVTPDSELARTLAHRLADVIAVGEPPSLEKVEVGQRSMPADGRTVAGFTGPDARFYVVATHSGITLAPLLGDLVAGEIHGHESTELADFRPGRFATGTPTAPAPPRRPGEQ